MRRAPSAITFRMTNIYVLINLFRALGHGVRRGPPDPRRIWIMCVRASTPRRERTKRNACVFFCVYMLPDAFYSLTISLTRVRACPE